MEELKVLKSNALAAYEQEDEKGKRLIANLLGRKHFITNTMELIDSFEAACEYNNTNPDQPRFTQGTPAGIAMEQLAEIAKALNGGKVLKGGEKRYYAYFEYASSGFRFRDSYFVISSAFSFGGPRLCTLTPELARYMGQKFIHLYDTFLNHE